MEWKVVKSIPLSEVQTRTSIFNEKYGSLSFLHEEFTKGRMPPGGMPASVTPKCNGISGRSPAKRWLRVITLAGSESFRDTQ